MVVPTVPEICFRADSRGSTVCCARAVPALCEKSAAFPPSVATGPRVLNSARCCVEWIMPTSLGEWFSGVFRDKRRNNWHCARAVRKHPLSVVPPVDPQNGQDSMRSSNPQCGIQILHNNRSEVVVTFQTSCRVPASSGGPCAGLGLWGIRFNCCLGQIFAVCHFALQDTCLCSTLLLLHGCQ